MTNDTKNEIHPSPRVRIAIGVAGSLNDVLQALTVIERRFDEPIDLWVPASLFPWRAQLQTSRVVRQVFFAPSPRGAPEYNGAPNRDVTVPVYGDYDEVIPFHASPLALPFPFARK